MSSSTNGFLDQFKDQLQEANSKPAEGEQQQWTQEQIQQYYQQYGYYDSSYYTQQEGQAQGGTQQQADYSAYPTSYSMDPYAGSYYGYGGAYGYSGYGSIMRALPAGGPGLPGEPSRSIWVGNVHEECSDQELQSFFAPFGMIESIKVLPAKGCAFIRFVELDAAIKAHSCMNGITVHGQQIKVGWGKAEPNAKDDGISGPPPCKNLWLGNINPDISEEQIRSAFSQFGFIEKVRILPQKGCAFVNFATLDAATNAKNQMQGATLIDRPVKINYGREGPNNGGIGDLSKPLESEKPKVPPPPPEGQPPDDYEHRKIIDKLAEFVSKNGLKFEFMIQEKHKDDPKYEFIEDGKPFNDYYRFKIWCCRYPDVDPKTYYEMQLQEESKPLVAKVPALYGAVPPPIALITAPRPPSPPPPVVEFSFSGDDESAITEIIDNLQPTRDYIRKAKNWIISKAADAGNIAAFVRAKVETIPDFDKKLNVLYLIHDVLHQAMRDRQPDQTTDAFSTAFQGHMAAMVKSMCHKESTDHREKVARVVRIWDEKKIFTPEAVKQYEQELGVPLIRDTPFTPPKEDKESKDHRDRDRDRDRHRRRDDDRDRDRDRRKRDRDRDRDRDYERDYERDYDRESKRRH